MNVNPSFNPNVSNHQPKPASRSSSNYINWEQFQKDMVAAGNYLEKDRPRGITVSTHLQFMKVMQGQDPKPTHIQQPSIQLIQEENIKLATSTHILFMNIMNDKEPKVKAPLPQPAVLKKQENVKPNLLLPAVTEEDPSKLSPLNSPLKAPVSPKQVPEIIIEPAVSQTPPAQKKKEHTAHLKVKTGKHERKPSKTLPPKFENSAFVNATVSMLSPSPLEEGTNGSRFVEMTPSPSPAVASFSTAKADAQALPESKKVPSPPETPPSASGRSMQKAKMLKKSPTGSPTSPSSPNSPVSKTKHQRKRSNSTPDGNVLSPKTVNPMGSLAEDNSPKKGA